MATTSLKIPEDLKQRTMDAARKQGVSAHAFMLQAIDQAVTATMLRSEFVANALAAKEEILRTGEGYAAEEVHAYIRAHIEGGASRKKLKAKPWRG